MADIIVMFNPENDDFVEWAGNVLYQDKKDKAVSCYLTATNSDTYNQDLQAASNDPISNIYLVAHGSNTRFNGYTDPKIMVAENHLGDILNQARCIYLISCSTGGQSQLTFDNGFVAKNFASNLKGLYRKQKVFASPTIMYASKNKIWVGYDHEQLVRGLGEGLIEIPA